VQSSAGTLKIALMLKPMDVPRFRPRFPTHHRLRPPGWWLGVGAVGDILGGGLGKRTSEECGADATSAIKHRAQA